MNPITNVALLREVYCRLVKRNLEPQLSADAEIPTEGYFFSPYLNQFCVEIKFGIPGFGDYRYSAQLQIYVPTPKFKEWPGDVHVSYMAMSDGRGESEDPPISPQIFENGPGDSQQRLQLCRWFNEQVMDQTREARLTLQRLDHVVT